MSIEFINEGYLPLICDTGSGHKTSRLIKVSEQSPEYMTARKMMVNFVKNFIAVYRVENTYLRGQYNANLKLKRNKNICVREVTLLHCTAKGNVRSIIENNFDPLIATRVKFGRGVSFSPSAAYANLQSSVDIGLDRAMFQCQVIIGETQVGERGAIPSPPIDTMVDRGGNVYVKHNKFEFYPTYVTFYESYPVDSYRGRRCIRKI